MKPLHLHVTLAASNHMAMNGSRMTVMLFAASLGASPALIGVLAALFGIVSAFTAVHVGRWIDRVGPPQPIMLASLHGDAGRARGGLRPRDLGALHRGAADGHVQFHVPD